MGTYYRSLVLGLRSMGYDRIRPSLDIETNLKSGIVRGGRSLSHGSWPPIRRPSHSYLCRASPSPIRPDGGLLYAGLGHAGRVCTRGNYYPLRRVVRSCVVFCGTVHATRPGRLDRRRNFQGWAPVKPHSALGYRPPAPETIIPMDQETVMH